MYEEEVDDEPGALVIDEESYEAHVTPLLQQIRVEVEKKDNNLRAAIEGIKNGDISIPGL